MDKNTLEDTIRMYREVQIKRFKLVTKNKKTEKDFAKLESLRDSEEKLAKTIEDLDPNFFEENTRV